MKKIYVLFISVFILFSQNVLAKNFEIVAIVGDTAISTIDLNERMELSLSFSGLPDTAETRAKLKPQILRTLIDEALYMQEARELRIDVTEEDLNQAIANLEKQNNITPGEFDNFIKEKKIPADAMMKQIRSQIIWTKILSRRIRPNIIVTEREIEEKLEHISNSSGISELDISEIVLPVDTPDDSKRVRLLAQDLYQEIKQGAEFESIAKEFSHSSTASAGGSLGWMREEHAPKEIISKVRNLQVGEVSLPFFVDSKYHIIKLNNRRALVSNPADVKNVKLKHAFVEIAKGTSKSKIMQIQERITKSAKNYNSCKDFARFAKKIGSQISTDTISLNVNDMNPEVIPAVIKTPVNKLTPPVPSPEGVHLFGVCHKEKPKAEVVLEDRLKEIITRRKLDLQAQRYLQKLRDKAFIEIRV
jgi:peptidyl-prolyl cis-trans isomerase SurA